MIEKTAAFIYQYILFFLPGGHPWDYVAHFIISLVGVIAITLFLQFIVGISFVISFSSAIATMLFVGIIKELNDIRLGKTASVPDMLSDIAGVGVAVLIILIAT